jgi:outer membrane protein
MARATERAVVLAAAAALLAAGRLDAQAGGARQVTLAEALALAARNAPAMVQARQNVRIAEAQQRQAFGSFLPSVNASVSASRSRVGQRFDPNTQRNVQVGNPYSESYSLTSSVDLFTGFRRGAQRRSADATFEQREATLLRQDYAVALATKQAFFNALAGAELVSVAETRLRRADEQLKLTSERLRLGATTRSDSLRARVEYGNAQLALIQAQNDLRAAQASLARQLGLEGVVAAAPDTALEVRVHSIDTAALRREAIATAPTVREGEASLAAARAQVAVNRAAYLPSLSATGTTSWSRAGSDLFGGALAPNWFIRLQLSYPLFNGFQREANLVTADANVRTAGANLRDARLQLEAQLTDAFADLEAAAARIDVSRVSVAAAEEDLRMQRERYRLGAATIVEVLTSQITLDQAQVDLVRARYDYLVARAQIEALVGHDL